MGLRVAMITRRFWPLVGGAESMMSNLADEFRRQGAEPTIITAQWRADWPTQMRHRGTPVVRLPSPKPVSWGVIRYLTSLSRWLRNNQDQFDAICVSRLQYDAYAAVSSLGGQMPILVRAEYAGESGDCSWLESVRFGGRLRRRIAEADHIIAPTSQIADEMLLAGFPAERIQLAPNGVPPVTARTPQSRRAARQSLAEANSDLASSPNAPIVLAIGPFHSAQRLDHLVRAFRQVAEQDPNANLWLIGDGDQREGLYRQIVDFGLHHQIYMPGNFDDIDDLMHAADVFVSANAQESRSAELMQAMSYGLPVVAADLPDNRELIEHGHSGMLAAADDVMSWAEAIRSLTQQPVERARIGSAARVAVATFSLERCAAAHLQLLHRREQ